MDMIRRGPVMNDRDSWNDDTDFIDGIDTYYIEPIDTTYYDDYEDYGN